MATFTLLCADLAISYVGLHRQELALHADSPTKHFFTLDHPDATVISLCKRNPKYNLQCRALLKALQLKGKHLQGDHVDLESFIN